MLRAIHAKTGGSQELVCIAMFLSGAALITTPNDLNSYLTELLKNKDVKTPSTCRLIVLVFKCNCMLHYSEFLSPMTESLFWLVLAQKNMHYLLVFDGFVILVCLVSAVLCTRSIVLAVRLLQVGIS